MMIKDLENATPKQLRKHADILRQLADKKEYRAWLEEKRNAEEPLADYEAGLISMKRREKEKYEEILEEILERCPHTYTKFERGHSNYGQGNNKHCHLICCGCEEILKHETYEDNILYLVSALPKEFKKKVMWEDK